MPSNLPKTALYLGFCTLVSVHLNLVSAQKTISTPIYEGDLSKKPKLIYEKPSKTSAVTLKKIVRDALRAHPNIEADKESLSAAEDVVTQAAAGYMPTIDLRMSLGRDNYKRDFNVNALNPLASIGKISATRTDPSIAIRQILFDGMGTSSRLDRARSQQHHARGALGVTVDTTIVEIASITIDLRRLQRLMRITQTNVRFHQIIRDKVAEIVDAGAAPISDLFQVEARLQDTLVSQSTVESDLAVVRAKFIEVTGKDTTSSIRRLHLPNDLMPVSVEMAVRMALDKNNALKVAKSNVKIAQTNYQESASKLVPTITLELEGERDRNMGGSSGYQNRMTAMVVARHNLFNGGADMAKSRENVKRLTESHARLNHARRQTERTIRAAWAEAKGADHRTLHLTKLIKEKRQIRESYLKEFLIGKRTLIDLLDAANDVFITEASRTSVDALADLNKIVLSVGTAQFIKYLHNPEEISSSEDDKEKSLSSLAHLTKAIPYFPKDKKHDIEKIDFKRKTMFEQRREARFNAFQGKTST